MTEHENSRIGYRPVKTLPDGRKVGRVVLKWDELVAEGDYSFVNGLLWTKRDGFVQLVAEVRENT